MRRVWIALYAGGFVIFAGIALAYNRAQGLALSALVLVILAAAFVYNRRMRRL
jgi:hypothetical protein